MSQLRRFDQTTLHPRNREVSPCLLLRGQVQLKRPRFLRACSRVDKLRLGCPDEEALHLWNRIVLVLTPAWTSTIETASKLQITVLRAYSCADKLRLGRSDQEAIHPRTSVSSRLLLRGQVRLKRPVQDELRTPLMTVRGSSKHNSDYGRKGRLPQC
jgi:hypothetical protein